MMKRTGVYRVLIGLVLLASFALSACGALRRADAAPDTEPVPPAVEGGESVFIDSVDVLILESWPVQVQVVVRGNLADGCTVLDQVRVARDEGTNRFEITIETTRDADAMCTMALVPFEETISLEVEGLSAGTYTVDVHGVSATFVLDADNVLAEQPVVEGGEGLYIDSVEALVLESQPGQVQVVILGNLADGCTRIEEYLIEHEEGSGLFKVMVGIYRDPDAICTMALVPVEETINLNVEGLPAGTYTVDVHGVTTTFELAEDM